MSVVTMDKELVGIELDGFGRLLGLARLAGGFRGRTESSASRFFKSGFIWLPVALIAGLGAWMLLSGYSSKPAESEPAALATGAVRGDSPFEPVVLATDPARGGPAPDQAPQPSEAVTPEQTVPVDGLQISSQSWRRGGLGSKALITFTLRNSNDYAVKDIEISCAFARRDGSHVTDRTRVIHDIVNMKSRKTFARLHVGFVNITADKAKCSLIAASHT
jgi:hypothetical protein